MNYNIFTALSLILLVTVTAQETGDSSSSTTTPAAETTTSSSTTISSTTLTVETTTTAAVETTPTTTPASETTTSDTTTTSSTTPAVETTTTAAVETTPTTTPVAETTTTTTTTPVAETTTTTTTTTEPTTTEAPSFSANVATSTENLRGINCMVESVNDVDDLILDFNYEFGLCGSKAKRDGATVLKEAGKIQNVAKRVIKANKNICSNGNYTDRKDAAKKPTDGCVKRIKTTMNSVNENIESTIQESNLLFERTTNICASIALLKFNSGLSNFNAQVTECARLAKNVK